MVTQSVVSEFNSCVSQVTSFKEYVRLYNYKAKSMASVDGDLSEHWRKSFYHFLNKYNSTRAHLRFMVKEYNSPYMIARCRILKRNKGIDICKGLGDRYN